MSGSAIWADALQALVLFAADPVGLGGMSVRAGAGPVRDRFLSLLYDTLRPGTPVRRLPLNVGDDRLLGGLDLAATLQAGRPIAQNGLLAEADGGVVVLSMAERIEPGTAARLRAALDEGTVTLQRDGLSRVLRTRIGVVALDEGVEPDERPPASLLDRFAFHLDLTGVSWGDVRDSLGDGDPSPGFGAGPTFVPGQDVERQTSPRLPSSRVPALDLAAPGSKAPEADTAATIEGDGKNVDALCHAALALGIDSIRAPLLALRTARIAAALSSSDHVTEDDLGLAARLVLAPRATRFPPPDEEPQSSEEPEQPPEPENANDEQQPLPDQPLADIVLDAAKAALPADLLATLAAMDGGRGLARAPGRAGQFKASVKRGRPIGIRSGEPKNGARLHLLETLKAAAPWQKLRGATDRFQVRRDDFRIIRFRQRIGTTTVFAVDASGSAAMNRLAEAKGAVELLLADCYVRRDQVALIAFRGTGATLLLAPTGSLLRAKRSLAGLPGGGPTPLAAGIEAAMVLAATIRRAGRTPVITVLTDARANIARDGSGGRPRAEAEALETARAVRASGVAALLVDTSPRPNPFARRLAEEMRARYIPLPYANASKLSQAVRAASAA
jgi:magnesium chelatase subunit D